MEDLLTAVGTAVRKRPRQLAGIVTRLAKSSVAARLPVDLDARYERLVPANPVIHATPLRQNTERLREAVGNRRARERERAAASAAGHIEFLNETVSFSGRKEVDAVGDRVNAKSLHWRLKFWGFEHLQSVWLGYDRPEDVPRGAIETHRKWLSEWREEHEIAATVGYLRKGWMPHSVSLRILNWCRYDAWLDPVLPESFQRDIRRFAYKNAAFLSNNIEHGVGGNHLIENAVALVVAGSYFEQTGWLEQGHHLLRQAATDQFFSDGGHFERSPMYHLIVTQRYLTSADLLSQTNYTSETITETAQTAVAFADAIRPPDGEIPLLNDSAFGEALSLAEIERYANVCELKPTSTATEQRRDCSETGYYWLGDQDDCLLAVGGDLAVEHLPAHAHAHPAQILVWADSRRVLTDTGVLEYAAGDARRRARSVRSHNTVQVNDKEPVQFGDSFHWFGNVSTSVERDRDKLSMAYEVEGIGQASYSHRRIIEYDTAGWTIVDDIAGVDSTATVRFHVHPNLRTEKVDSTIQIFDSTTEEDLLTVRLASECNLSIEESPYYPTYGLEQNRDVIVVSRDDDGQIKTRLSLQT